MASRRDLFASSAPWSENNTLSNPSNCSVSGGGSPMFDLETARTITRRELSELIALAAGLDEASWAKPTRCAGWSIRDLCSHAGLAATQQAEAFRRANKGVLEQPEYPGAPQLS